MTTTQTAEGQEDRWIAFIAETFPLPSVGLSHLMIHLAFYIALRAMLVSMRCVGASAISITPQVAMDFW
jgi:hypothetical protein